MCVYMSLLKNMSRPGFIPFLWSHFSLLEYNNYIVDSVLQLDVGGVSWSRETENIETNNRPYLHSNSDANVIHLSSMLEAPRCSDVGNWPGITSQVTNSRRVIDCHWPVITCWLWRRSHFLFWAISDRRPRRTCFVAPGVSASYIHSLRKLKQFTLILP